MHLQNLIVTIISKFGVTLLNALVIAVIANFFGAKGVGSFALLRTIPLLYCVITDLGLSHSYSFLINSKKYILREVVSSQVVCFIFIAFFQVLLWLLFDDYFLGLFGLDIPFDDRAILSLVAPCILFQSHLINILRATGSIVSANMISVLVELAILLLLIIAVHKDGNMMLFPYILAISYCLMSTLYIAFYYKKIFSLSLFPSKNIIKTAFRFGIKSLLGNSFQILNYRLDQLIVSFFLGPGLLGTYVIAIKCAEAFKILTLAIVFVFEPSLSKLEPREAYLFVKSKIIKLISVNASLVLAGIFIVPFFIPLIFSGWSETAITPFIIISIGIALSGGNGLYCAFFLGHGKPGVVTKSIGFGLLATIISNLVLVPKFGIIGASLSSCIGYIVITILLMNSFFNQRKYNDKQ
jgi:O-antigen/teichoic acid export membrane protein